MPTSPYAIIGLLLATLIAGCSRDAGNPAPPRADTPAQWPAQTSSIVVPVTSNLDALARGLEKQIPKTLWRIDEHKDDCVPAQRVDIGIAKLKVLPKLGCRIVGQVTRGRLTLGGSGDTLDISFPVNAVIGARDVGGVVKKQDATGSAIVHATAKLGIVGNWRPTAEVDIRYDWTNEPGINILGQRIEFVRKADERLKPIIAKLERTLPDELAKLHLRQELAGVWHQGFTSLSLNRNDPPVWLRVTPKDLGVGGYNVSGRTLELTLAARALTETFVGEQPADPTPTPLPPPARTVGREGLNFYIPVLAGYRELEPVVQRALTKLAAKGIDLTGIGPVDAEFGRVKIYATTAAHLAVGVETKVKARGVGAATTKGVIWLTAIPYNESDSQILRARDISIAGKTDSRIANILVALFDDTAVVESIRTGLTHDFAPDYAKILAKAKSAIGERREGDFILSATIDHVTNGQVKVTGQGLFLPVKATGKASIAYAPR
ncbi:MAG: DUF4403 family protein [Sphingomonas bacterium]|nr:DUF4403 family protein [Sphingomonas bacterium]